MKEWIKPTITEWFKVSDKMPEDGAEVLTGYWVEDLGYWQIEIMQFFKKGTRIGERLDTDPGHSMLKRIANAIFNRYYEILAPEDGFYYLSYDNLNDAQLKNIQILSRIGCLFPKALNQRINQCLA